MSMKNNYSLYGVCFLLCMVIESSLTVYAKEVLPEIIILSSFYITPILYIVVNIFFSLLFASAISEKKTTRVLFYGVLFYCVLELYLYIISGSFISDIMPRGPIEINQLSRIKIAITAIFLLIPFFQLIPFLLRTRAIKLYIKPLLLSFGISFGLSILFRIILSFSDYLGYDNLPEFISPWGYPINLQRIHYYIDMLLILRSLRLVSQEVKI